MVVPKTKSKRKEQNKPVHSDAVALLKADHREVEKWFDEYEKARGARDRLALAKRICAALTVHTQVEEEIFYPAFLRASSDRDLHHEAAIEHAGAKALIAQLESSVPTDEYYDARMKVLSEMIKHHVNEEEQRGGMFAKAKATGMDLEALGARMATRKNELTASR
jgi:Hemerythrin HHE cation binding domain